MTEPDIIKTEHYTLIFVPNSAYRHFEGIMRRGLNTYPNVKVRDQWTDKLEGRGGAN